MRMRKLRIAWLALGLVALAGCNLFTGMHEDGKETNASVLTADGQAALSRGDYSNAVAYFRQAIAADPRDGNARLGYADALLKAQNFNLTNFIKTLVANSGGGQTAVTLVNPADWGLTSVAQLIALLTTLIDTLDPVALGQVSGPVATTSVTTNLNVGFLYVLRTSARMQGFATTLVPQQFSKASVTFAQLGLPDQAALNALLPQLPDTFWWIAGSPNPGELLQVQSDIDAGLGRLRFASQHSTSPKLIDDMINLFGPLQIQAHP